MVVLDTSALLYWTLDPDQLSLTARRTIEQADRLVQKFPAVNAVEVLPGRGLSAVGTVHQFIVSIHGLCQMRKIPAPSRFFSRMKQDT